MRYGAADLNLLKVFEALMAEGNVTRAAERLALTQPAVSNALRRLRDTFGDALFVRHGGGVRPTRRALEMWTPLALALHTIRAGIEGDTFDPRHSPARLSVAMSDYVSAILAPRLLERLGREAPQVRLQSLPAAVVDFGPLLAADQVDFAIGARNDDLQRPAFLRSRALWTVRFACVMRRGHPLARPGRLSLQDFLAARHVDVAQSGAAGPLYDELLRSRGLQRQLVATVGHYAAACEVVRRTDLIAVLPWSGRLEPGHPAGLRRMAPPVPAPPRTVELFWHQRHEASAAHQWLRRMLLELFAGGGRDGGRDVDADVDATGAG